MLTPSKSHRLHRHKQPPFSPGKGARKQCLAQMLKEMGYPSIRATCMECTLPIVATDASVTCTICLRSVHVMCSVRMRE